KEDRQITHNSMLLTFALRILKERLSPDCRPRNSQPHCQRSSFAYTAKPNLNNHRPQRIGLPGQRRTPTPLMEPVPPFRGIRKVADSQRESTGNSRTFDILRPVAVVQDRKRVV